MTVWEVIVCHLVFWLPKSVIYTALVFCLLAICLFALLLSSPTTCIIAEKHGPSHLEVSRLYDPGISLGDWALNSNSSFHDSPQLRYHWPLFLCGLVVIKENSGDWTEESRWPLLSITTWSQHMPLSIKELS